MEKEKKIGNATVENAGAANNAEREGAPKIDELKFTAKLVMDTFYDENKSENVPFVAIKLPHPFDKDEEDLGLAFNSDKYKDSTGKPKKDKTKSLFKHDAKKALLQAESIEIPGVIRYKTFRDKKERKDVNYVSIVIYNPFDNGAAVNMYIKNFDAAALFERYVKERFNLYVEPLREGQSLGNLPT